MSRPLRIEFPGALYHVMSRGNARSDIVADDLDRQRRLDWLARTVKAHGWQLHAFVLMTNHEHLFVQTPRGNLSGGMKLLNGAYTQYFNVRHGRSGHLLQGRYKAHLVEDRGHYAQLSRYLHLNPVRAGMVEDPVDYRWSSFPGYCRKSRASSWVVYDQVLGDHGPGDATARRRRYAVFVRKALGEQLRPPWKSAWHGLVIGSRAFLEGVKARLDLSQGDPELTGSQAMVRRPPIGEVVTRLAEALGVPVETWSKGSRSDAGQRAVVAYVARRLLGYGRGEVAEALGYRSASSVAHAETRVSSTHGLEREARQAAAAMSSSSS